MQKLLWRDYQKSGFLPKQAVALADFSARLNKLYLSPSHMNSKIAEQCNAVTKKALEFINKVTSETYQEIWSDLFEHIGEDIACMNQMALNAFSESTGIEFHLLKGNAAEDRNLWEKLNPVVEVGETLSEQQAQEILEYRLIGGVPAVVDDAPPLLRTEVMIELQNHLDHTSLGLLVVPGNTYDPNKTFLEIVSKVHQCNIQMDEATGWGEDALGLKGRVHLMLGCVYTGDTGLCSKHNLNGDSAQHDPVVIKTSPFNNDWILLENPQRKNTDYLFSPLGHEWLHALDYVAQEGREVSMVNMSKSLAMFNEKMDTLSVDNKEKEHVFEFYKHQVLFCVYQCLAQKWSAELEKETSVFIENVLGERQVSEEKIKQFLEKHEFDEESWVQISIRLAVAHKIKEGAFTEMPFLMRNRALDENVMVNGGRAYLTLPMERLAYSFEKSLNQFNPLNSHAGIYSPSDAEVKVLRNQWKDFFEENKANFMDMSVSHLWVEEKEKRIHRKALRQDFLWQMQSVYRKTKEAYVKLDHEVTHLVREKTRQIFVESTPQRLKKPSFGPKN